MWRGSVTRTRWIPDYRRRPRSVCWTANAVQMTVHMPPQNSHAMPRFPAIWFSSARAIIGIPKNKVPTNEKNASSANP